MIHPFVSPLLKERGKVIGVASGLSRAITTAGWPRCGGRAGEQGGSRVSVVLLPSLFPLLEREVVPSEAGLHPRCCAWHRRQTREGNRGCLILLLVPRHKTCPRPPVASPPSTGEATRPLAARSLCGKLFEKCHSGASCIKEDVSAR